MVLEAELPRARELPLIGSLYHYLRAPLPFLEEAAKRGPLVKMRFAQHGAYLVNDPALVEQVLVKLPGSFQKDMFLRQLKRVLGEGLLTSEGDFWKRQRRLIQPAFHRERIAGYGRIMTRSTTAAIDRWRGRSSIDLHHEMMSLTADIVTHALFGGDAGDTSEVSECIETVMARFGDPAYLLVPPLRHLPTRANRRYREVGVRLDAIVQSFIARRRKEDPAVEHDDLLAMLLAAQDEDGGRMTDRQVRDEILILFLAGHETTALALSWTFHLLAKNERVERELHAELASVLGGREPTVEDLPKLPYTEAVAQEVLRLYPPAWSLGREAAQPLELGGVKFDKGSWFWIIPWTLHRDGRTFADPLEFRPERWRDGLAKRLSRGAYLPFGAGPRICIGNAFAMMELALLIATIAQRFSLKTLESAPPAVPDPAITLRFKHGLTMAVAERRAADERRPREDAKVGAAREAT